VGAIRCRTAKVERLRDALIALAPDERAIGVAWLSGSLPEGPLGLGPAIVHAMRHVPGAAATTLSVAQAHGRLDALRAIGGKGSAARRKAALAELFSQATPAEQNFLARLLVGELRQGALEGVMADAIAAAAGAPPADVRRAIMLAGAIGPVAAAALEAGAEGLARFRLTLYKPVSPMLASPTQDVASALTALTRAIFEFKLDGARVQIHKGARGVRIYSRTGNDVTASLPEIVATTESLGAERLILDGEVIALEPSGRPRPFQQTMRRFGRKLGVAETQTELPLSLFCFDCLQAGGIDLLDRPTAARAAALEAIVPASLTVPRLVTSSRDAAEAFLREALDAGHEGLVAKSPSAPYEAGNRGSSWLKIKVAHTLDLVILAAEWGNGRRRGWLSNLHLGARAGDGGFVMLGKTFKGLTDELLEWQTQKLRSLAIGRTDGYVVHVRPELVVEIAFNELQRSSRYPGGLALRFARVVRYRPDKTAADADTIETVRRIAGISSES
jgi:DNA ligase-1